ncbi:MAG: hypothetical protein F6K09_02870 [Merismopedia sp. SIO2A8]|nr:hypothetical protein [Merismopedia sp. SIO2A8]
MMVVRALKFPLDARVAVGMIGMGIGTALMWRMGLHLSQDIYEVLPGMVAGTMTYLLAQPLLSTLEREA